jgi:hypothetical protein
MINFVNDPRRDSFSIQNAQMAPLMPGAPLGSSSRPQIVIRRPQIVLQYFTAAETRASIRTLVKKEMLVAYTPVAVCRGYFHMSAEAKLHDFLDSTSGNLLVVSDVRIFPLVDLSLPFPAEAEKLLIGQSQIIAYHSG